MFGRRIFPDQIDTSISGRKIEATEKSTMLYPVRGCTPLYPVSNEPSNVRTMGTIGGVVYSGAAASAALELQRQEEAVLQRMLHEHRGSRYRVGR